MFTFFDNNVRGGNICEPKLPTAISPNSSRNILMEQGTKGTMTFHAPLVFDFLTKPKVDIPGCLIGKQKKGNI